jgi:hypothetical protein
MKKKHICAYTFVQLGVVRRLFIKWRHNERLGVEGRESLRDDCGEGFIHSPVCHCWMVPESVITEIERRIFRESKVFKTMALPEFGAEVPPERATGSLLRSIAEI